MDRQLRGAPSADHISVLSYWHKIEFFIPFDLQRQVLEGKDAEWNVRLISAAQLARMSPEALWSAPVPDGRKLSGFDVFLGVFDKAELAEVTHRVIGEPSAPTRILGARAHRPAGSCRPRLRSIQGGPGTAEARGEDFPCDVRRIACACRTGLETADRC